MNEEIREVEMYSYTINNKELWTSNETFVMIRAMLYDTDVYVEKVTIKE